MKGLSKSAVSLQKARHHGNTPIEFGVEE